MDIGWVKATKLKFDFWGENRRWRRNPSILGSRGHLKKFPLTFEMAANSKSAAPSSTVTTSWHFAFCCNIGPNHRCSAGTRCSSNAIHNAPPRAVDSDFTALKAKPIAYFAAGGSTLSAPSFSNKANHGDNGWSPKWKLSVDGLQLDKNFMGLC